MRILRRQDWFHEDGFPLAVERRDPQEAFGPHTHEFSELVIITAGQGLHVVGTDSWQLSAGDVFVIAGPRSHSYRKMKDLHLINILYDDGFLQSRMGDLATVPGFHAMFALEPAWRKRHRFNSRLHLPLTDLTYLTGMVDALENELRERPAGFQSVSSSLFIQLVAYLARCYGRGANPDSEYLLALGQAISYLETRFTEEITLDRLAEIARMPKRTFVRTFQTAMGRAPIAYLINVRLARAASQLRKSDDSITDIAFSVGFSDSNYFTRQFRKVYGVSPRDYRERAQLPRG